MINYVRQNTPDGINTSSTYDVIHENGVKFGELYMEVDGYYVWDSLGGRGYLEAHVLRNIADKLDELNKDWDIAVHIHSGF